MTTYTKAEADALAAICGIENSARLERKMADDAPTAEVREFICGHIADRYEYQRQIVQRHPGLVSRWLKQVEMDTEDDTS